MLSAVVLDQSQHSIDIVLNCITRRCWLAATEKTHSLTAGQPVNGPCKTRNGCHHSHQSTKRYFQKHSFCAKSCCKRQKKKFPIFVCSGDDALYPSFRFPSRVGIKTMLKLVDMMLIWVNYCNLLTDIWSSQVSVCSRTKASLFLWNRWLWMVIVYVCCGKMFSFCTLDVQQQRA